MNKIKRLLLNQAPISIVSLALAATISISAISIDANADDQMSDSKETVVTSNETMSLLKITDALIAGTITAEEAAKKIQTVNRIDMYLTTVETEISDEVENGTLTVEEGMAKYDEAVQRINKRMAGGEKNSNDRIESYLKKVGTKIREAVANGEITAEEGKAKYAEAEAKMQQRMGQQKNDGSARMESYLKKVGTEIREAVANGEMTAEEGKAEYADAEAKIQQRMGKSQGNNNDRVQVYLTKIGTELRQSVANGEISAEEGKAKYLEAVVQMKERRASRKDGAGRGGNRDRGDRNSSGRER